MRAQRSDKAHRSLLDTTAQTRRLIRARSALELGISKWRSCCNLTFVTLTTADNVIKNISHSFELLKKRLTRIYGIFDYIKIRTTEGNGVLHLIWNLPFISEDLISDLWYDIHDSYIVKLRTLWYGRGLRNYLANYLKNQGRLSYSFNWIAKGWRRIFRFYNRVWQIRHFPRLDHVPKSVICWLSYYKEYYKTIFPIYWNNYIKTYEFPTMDQHEFTNDSYILGLSHYFLRI